MTCGKSLLRRHISPRWLGRIQRPPEEEYEQKGRMLEAERPPQWCSLNEPFMVDIDIYNPLAALVLHNFSFALQSLVTMTRRLLFMK